MKIKVIKAGLFTTIQDLGRFGYSQFGIPSSGAVDTRSAQLANQFVGNDDNEAVLEITMTGPTIEFDSHCGIAISGADISPRLNNHPIDNNIAYEVERGDRLSFGKLKNGCRAYVAISGSIQVEPIYSSKSTYTYAKIGGFLGRQLKKNDEIVVKEKALPVHRLKEEIPTMHIGTTHQINVSKGPEYHVFNKADINTLLNTPFKVSTQSNRMGVRLEGETINKTAVDNIITSGVVFGTVQIPPSGQPIILLNDAGTTGGYPRIVNCLSDSFQTLAQVKATDLITFVL